MGLSDGTRRKLIREYGFYGHALEWQARAGFKCEYCDADLLANIDVYHGSWERDHIVPRAAGGSDSLENSALACSFCNYNKGAWDPRSDPQVVDGAGRDALVAATRRYLQERRTELRLNREDLERELAEVRELIQREMEL